jgi:CO dehydrogenase/acetyl-CoA synthase epsilon subunit
MILAMLPDESKTESLLNNLSEADFDLNDVSVIMQDVALRDKIAKDAGPLKGMKPAQVSGGLKRTGVSAAIAQQCLDAVKHGKVLVAMQVDPKYEPAAREMFTDMSAEFLEE